MYISNSENRSNPVISYMIYMANSWSLDEAQKTFGFTLGEHIWYKYIDFIEIYGQYGAYSMLMYSLDDNNADILVERAEKLYDGRKNK
jgi:hypothetical protein